MKPAGCVLQMLPHVPSKTFSLHPSSSGLAPIAAFHPPGRGAVGKLSMCGKMHSDLSLQQDGLWGSSEGTGPTLLQTHTHPPPPAAVLTDLQAEKSVYLVGQELLSPSGRGKTEQDLEQEGAVCTHTEIKQATDRSRRKKQKSWRW